MQREIISLLDVRFPFRIVQMASGSKEQQGRVKEASVQ